MRKDVGTFNVGGAERVAAVSAGHAANVVVTGEMARSRGELPEASRRMLGGPGREARSEVLSMSFRRTGAPVARTMIALRVGDLTADDLSAATSLDPSEMDVILETLVGLEYIGVKDGPFGALTPVLDARDEPMARRVLAIGREVMERWLAATYDDIRADLSDLAFTRAGVPFEGSTMIWHSIFGMAIQKLVEAGLFADPYAPDRTFHGAVPVVSALDLCPGRGLGQVEEGERGQ